MSTHLEVDIVDVPHLSTYAGEGCKVLNTYHKMSIEQGSPVRYTNYQNEEDFLVYDIVRKAGIGSRATGFVRAGPRELRYFDKSAVAAIVTCGGICPGLNNVIKELVMSLHTLYGNPTVLGVQHGFWGFSDGTEPLHLTPRTVHEIDRDGGTILGSDRGGMLGYEEQILQYIADRAIKMLFVIGGDGSHRGAIHLAKLLRERDQAVAVAGIPKTIDNDVAVVDFSFGFRTAVEHAVKAILSAKTEAKCLRNGIGMVKLMGRHAGYIACFASIASGVVDLCLLPELEISLEGRNSHLEHLRRVVADRGHAVVVVAEGAGEEILGESATLDAGGNRQLPEIGPFLKHKIIDYFATTEPKTKVTIKYIDPSYMVRSVAANSNDALMCFQLAQNAVHGAVAGFTEFMTGMVNNRLVYLPMQLAVDQSPRKIRVKGRTIERLLASTGQPQNLDAKL